ncbi:hypothetical protein [Streptomyces sp. NPDC092370]|uniref:hypothetical protein n=1 Tax=Streptomyces sp. NPDC092370 TaxID=3366016 RepID=UPI0037F712C9
MHSVLPLKVGTQVRVSRPGFGMVGTIRRVLPHLGAYHVEGWRGIELVKASEHDIETYTDRRGY